MLTHTGTGFPEALDTPGMCTLPLSSAFPPDKVSQMPFCFSLKVSWSAAEAPEVSSLPQLQPQPATCQQQKDICQKTVQVLPARKIPYNPRCIQSLTVRAEI